MVTITATKPNGDKVAKQVPAHRADDFVAYFVAYGYTDVSDDRAATKSVEVKAEATAEREAVRTGRTRTGKVVHELVLGSAKCGASFRRNRLGNTVKVTGETVTCVNCLK